MPDNEQVCSILAVKGLLDTLDKGFKHGHYDPIHTALLTVKSGANPGRPRIYPSGLTFVF